MIAYTTIAKLILSASNKVNVGSHRCPLLVLLTCVETKRDAAHCQPENIGTEMAMASHSYDDQLLS